MRSYRSKLTQRCLKGRPEGSEVSCQRRGNYAKEEESQKGKSQNLLCATHRLDGHQTVFMSDISRPPFASSCHSRRQDQGKHFRGKLVGGVQPPLIPVKTL
eukprot:768684-Hanusia_phi.AAC.2